MVFQCINSRQVPREMLKTAAFGLGFQHLPWDLANVNAWKTMFDPYNVIYTLIQCLGKLCLIVAISECLHASVLPPFQFICCVAKFALWSQFLINKHHIGIYELGLCFAGH